MIDYHLEEQKKKKDKSSAMMLSSIENSHNNEQVQASGTYDSLSMTTEDLEDRQFFNTANYDLLQSKILAADP